MRWEADSLNVLWWWGYLWPMAPVQRASHYDCFYHFKYKLLLLANRNNRWGSRSRGLRRISTKSDAVHRSAKGSGSGSGIDITRLWEHLLYLIEDFFADCSLTCASAPLTPTNTHKYANCITESKPSYRYFSLCQLLNKTMRFFICAMRKRRIISRDTKEGYAIKASHTSWNDNGNQIIS